MDTVDTSGFQPRTLDKVERLLDLLDEIQLHPDLKGKLAMHGGTAINLFMLGIPRLSVDIDISYIGALPRDEMLLERPFIERAIEEVGQSQGYSVSGAAGGHIHEQVSVTPCPCQGKSLASVRGRLDVR